MTSDSHRRMACINEGIRRPGARQTHWNGRLMTPSTTFRRHWKEYEEARRPIVEKLLGAADSCSMVRKLSSAYGTSIDGVRDELHPTFRSGRFRKAAAPISEICR